MSDQQHDQRRETAEIKAHLTARIQQIAETVCPPPKAHRSGHYWIGCCPWRADTNPGSFWINLGGKAPGTFKDAASGEKGDVFKLIQQTYGLTDFRATLQWARDFLGWQRMPEGDRHRVVERVAADRAHVEAREAERLAENRRHAFGAWVRAGKIAGTEGERYLKTRGIDLGRLARVPGAIKFQSNAKHIETNTFWPAIISAMTGPDGTVWAVHRIFLAKDGSGKAPVVPVRKIWPSFSGAAIRLWRGESGLPEREAREAGLCERLVLCEGVEDGLSVVMGDSRPRVWAAGSLGNLQHIVLPECCDEVVVCADNDWGKPQAEKQLLKALDALAAQGRKVSVARSRYGKDVNDALMGKAG